MFIVAFGSRQGTGFGREEADGRPVPDRYWRTASALLDREIQQPPGELRTTGEHPIWGLRRVRVEDEWHWCFSVQGQGGAFGAAGTCRFGFLPAVDVSAAEAWARGRKDVAGTGSLRPPTGETRRLVGALLQALVDARQAIDVNQPPMAAAGVIERALYVVPAAVAQRYAWHTCLIQRPEVHPTLGIVSGRMPDGFAEFIPAVARQVDHAMRSRVSGGTRPVDPGALECLANWAMDRTSIAAKLKGEPTSMVEVVEEVASQYVTVSPDQIPKLLGSETGRKRLAQPENLGVLQTWVHEDPRRALEHAEQRPQVFASAVFGLVVDWQREVNLMESREAPRNVVIALKGTRSADMLAQYAHERGEDVGAVVVDLVIGNRPRPSDSAVAQLRPFLHRLGIRPADHPDLFTPSEEDILDALRAMRHKREEVRQGARQRLVAELRLAARPVHWLADEVLNRAPFAGDSEYLVDCLEIAADLVDRHARAEFAGDLLDTLRDSGQYEPRYIDQFVAVARTRGLFPPLAREPEQITRVLPANQSSHPPVYVPPGRSWTEFTDPEDDGRPSVPIDTARPARDGTTVGRWIRKHLPVVGRARIPEPERLPEPDRTRGHTYDGRQAGTERLVKILLGVFIVTILGFITLFVIETIRPESGAPIGIDTTAPPTAPATTHPPSTGGATPTPKPTPPAQDLTLPPEPSQWPSVVHDWLVQLSQDGAVRITSATLNAYDVTVSGANYAALQQVVHQFCDCRLASQLHQSDRQHPIGVVLAVTTDAPPPARVGT